MATGEAVAMKYIRYKGKSEAITDAMLLEIDIVSCLAENRHKNCVRFTHAFQTAEDLCLVSEIGEGKTLSISSIKAFKRGSLQ